jgi:hypothetical protein
VGEQVQTPKKALYKKVEGRGTYRRFFGELALIAEPISEEDKAASQIPGVRLRLYAAPFCSGVL